MQRTTFCTGRALRPKKRAKIHLMRGRDISPGPAPQDILAGAVKNPNAAADCKPFQAPIVQPRRASAIFARWCRAARASAYLAATGLGQAADHPVRFQGVVEPWLRPALADTRAYRPLRIVLPLFVE
jgi:hypothetical protein